jgi:CDP-diglyceride synthetase
VHYQLLARLLILLAVANGSPVIAKRIFGERYSQPLDWGTTFIDGKPVFGPSKTIRGILSSIIATTASGFLLGIEPEIGGLIAVAAMSGDLLSSFIKRRLGLQSSSQVLGLDQVPESVLPLLGCSFILPITVADILMGTALFIVAELLLSRLLFKLRVRDRPY